MTKEEADKLNLQAAKDNGNDSAFPNKDAYGILHYGLTKREHMATQLMSAFLKDYGPQIAADRAVDAADYLLIELNKNK